MAPTTLSGQKATTAPTGRKAELAGLPLKISEMIAEVPSAIYVERVSLHHPKYIRKAKKAVLRGFTYQLQNLGFSMVELLSTCPTGWGLDPVAALEW